MYARYKGLTLRRLVYSLLWCSFHRYSSFTIRPLIILLLIVLGPSLLGISKTYYETPTGTSLDQSSSSSKQTDTQCKKYDFIPIDFNTTHRPLPIYDFFIFNDEFDVLEIRLYELYQYVTLFIIAESRETLTGREKPLYLKENWSRFAKYHDKIRRVEVTLVRNITNPWLNEYRMRNEGLLLALSTITE